MPPYPDWFSRTTLAIAGILGGGGVAAAAAASHSGDDRILGAVALIALTHAAALVAFALSSPSGRLLRAGALLIAAGACLFSGDLAARQLLDIAPLPMSAPAGATVIVAGWLLVTIAGLIGRQ